jgi:hypothetical protein
VRAYLDQRRQQMEIIATTTTRRGSVYDWIYPESQVPGGQLASPPPLDPLPEGDACKPTTVRSELDEEPEAWGPPGTVPILRIDPDRIHAPGTVQDFLSKYGDVSDIPLDPFDGPPPQIPPATNHYHARSAMTATNFGGEGYFNVWTPFVLHPREQSLAQIAVTAKTAAGVRQTIEAGWQVQGALYGDFATRFFVFFTTNGYTVFDHNLGGYNTLQSGWVQISPTFTPGTIITPTSVLGGEQVEMYLRIELHQGTWWVKRENEFVGYFPASLFAPDGLQMQASFIHFFGETFDDPNIPGMTVSDMGSGKSPLKDKAWQRNTAYVRYLQYQASSLGYDRQKYVPGLVEPTNANCYDITALADEAWQSHIIFGGDGQSQKCP